MGLAGVAYWFKTEAVQRRGAALFEGGEVVGRTVPLVAGEAVLGENFAPLGERAIAKCFREDRRGGDRKATGVAVNQRFLRDGDVDGRRVDEKIIGCDGELF